MLVHLVQPLAERRHRDAELREQAQFHEHGLHQTNDGRVVVLIAVEGGQPEGGAYLIVKYVITDFEEAALHLLVFG